MIKQENIIIIGAGAFGFAMANLIGNKNKDKIIHLYDINSNLINFIKKNQTHKIFFKNEKLSKNVIAKNNLKEILPQKNIIFLAIPSKFLREFLKNNKEYFLKNKKIIFVNLAKGLEIKTNKRISQIINEELKDLNLKFEICVLSGGMIAKEIIYKNPLCCDIATNNKIIGENIKKLIDTNFLRIQITDDIVGTEFAGAFKNVVAIGCGIFDGLNYPTSSKSAFISLICDEIKILSIKLGSRKKSFQVNSQSFMGDLLTTCFGSSRNKEFGKLIGQTNNAKNSLEKMKEENKSVEGFLTTKVAYKLSLENNLDLPLIKNLYCVLYENLSAKDFVEKFILENS